MVFPNNDYITFSIDKSNPASFTFPTKKPKKDLVRCWGCRCSISI